MCQKLEITGYCSPMFENGITEAGQGADSLSSIASIMSTRRGWRTRHPRTSCPAGSEGAGLVAGSERVRRAATLVLTIGGGG